MRISVVMSVYNGAPTLAKAVDSVLGQTFADFEFVIIDDGSTDGSTEMLRTYAAQDSRIRLIEQENTGLTQALIRGAAAARGDYIARQDADDWSVPHRFARQLALLDNRPDAVAATSDIMFVAPAGAYHHRPRGRPETFGWFNTFCNDLAGHGQMMFRRIAYEEAGGYDTAHPYTEDYDLWDRLMQLGPILHVPEPLYYQAVGRADSISTLHAPEQYRCALVICRRAYQRLTGQTLAEDDARTLREFWSSRRVADFPPRLASRADRLLRRALAAAPEAQRREIAQVVGARWTHWGKWTPKTAPFAKARAVLRGATWRWAAPRAAGRAASANDQREPERSRRDLPSEAALADS